MAKRTGILAFLIICPLIIHAAAITINTGSQRAAISPLIYGTNQQMEGGENLTVMRIGGNRMTGYNWENNASSAGMDWYNSSDDYMCGAIEYPLSATECANTSGGVLEHFVDYCIGHNYKSIVTLPMAGYVAADKNGNVVAGEEAPSARWKQVVNVKGSAFAYPPNTADNFVYVDEEIWHLVQKYGNSASPNGVMAYQLDNEADIWNGTHPMIHPAPVGALELVTRSVALATAIKNTDSTAQVFGPVFAMIWSMDATGDTIDWPGIKTAGGYNWYVDYYLDELSQASTAAGKRLLDAIDIHYYSEAAEGLYPPYSYSTGCRITSDTCNSAAAQLSRLQSPRSLWDPAFIENSSVGQWLQPVLPLLPKLQASINAYYPGTKIAVTEHGFGGGTDYSGGICVADVLGIFGKYGVYVATMWKSGYGIYHSAAYKLYRNYNGSNGVYGDTKVACDSNDIPNITSYASINGTDESKLHIILLNKAATAQTANVNITSGLSYNSGEAWAFDAASSNITLRTAPVIAGNSFSYSLPAHSAFHFILSSNVTPTNTPNWTASPTFTRTGTRTNTPNWTATPTFTRTATRTNTPNWTATRTPSSTATVPVTILNTCDSLTYNGTLTGGANSSVSINTTVPAAITEGTGSLKINVTTATGWNDGLMSCNGILTTDWSGYATLTMDVYVDPANLPWLPASGYHELQLFVNTSNGKDYRKISFTYGLVPGINHLTIVLDPSLDTDDHSAQANPLPLSPMDPITDYFFVLNSDGANAKTGVFYLDNLVLHAKPATSTPTTTATYTGTVYLTPTGTFTRTMTFTRTQTSTRTATSTRTVTLTGTETPVCSPTESATASVSPTVYISNTPTRTITGTPPTATITGTITQTGTDTATETATVTETITPTFTAADTSSFTPTITATSQNPTQTRTITRTPTPTKTQNPSVTPTPSRTAGITAGFEITGVLVYPDPLQLKGVDITIRCSISGLPSLITIKVYTNSFRKIREISRDTGLVNGDNLLQLTPADTANLSNGIYFYLVTAENSGGEKARARLGQFVILR